MKGSAPESKPQILECCQMCRHCVFHLKSLTIQSLEVGSRADGAIITAVVDEAREFYNTGRPSTMHTCIRVRVCVCVLVLMHA
jgi:hypothetical protein